MAWFEQNTVPCCPIRPALALQPTAQPPLQSIHYVISITLFVWLFLPIPLADELYKGDLCTALDTAESRDHLPESPRAFPGQPFNVGHSGRVCSCLDWNAAARTHSSCLSLVCHSLGVGILASALPSLPLAVEHQLARGLGTGMMSPFRNIL